MIHVFYLRLIISRCDDWEVLSLNLIYDKFHDIRSQSKSFVYKQYWIPYIKYGVDISELSLEETFKS